MPVELLNPVGLPQADVYRQVAIATGTRTVYLSGQVARDADGNPVGEGDLAAQVAQALTNVHTAITAVGGTFDDIAKLTIYLVDWQPEKMDAFVTGVLTAAGTLGFDPTKAVTLLGVAALGEPDLLVEIEAVAVLP